MKLQTKIAYSVGLIAIGAIGFGAALSVAKTVAKTEAASPFFAPATAKDISAQPSGAYGSEPTHTSVYFKYGHQGYSVYNARFDKVNIDLNFDAKSPTKSSVNANIETASVSTGLPSFDKEMADKFFLGQANPTITFKSTKLVQTGAASGKMTGDLTFRGVTKPVTLDVTFNKGGIHMFAKKPVLGFSAHGFVNRSDFGFADYIPYITDKVEISIEAEMIQK